MKTYKFISRMLTILLTAIMCTAFGLQGTAYAGVLGCAACSAELDATWAAEFIMCAAAGDAVLEDGSPGAAIAACAFSVAWVTEHMEKSGGNALCKCLYNCNAIPTAIALGCDSY